MIVDNAFNVHSIRFIRVHIICIICICIIQLQSHKLQGELDHVLFCLLTNGDFTELEVVFSADVSVCLWY